MSGLVNAPAPVVYFVVPAGIDDPAQVSGGNLYDLRVRDELLRLGWDVRLIRLDTAHPDPLMRLSSGALVLVDGLLAGVTAGLVPDLGIRVVVLAHLPPDALGPQPDARWPASASHIIATSHWTRAQLIVQHGTPADRTLVAHPGVDAHHRVARIPPGTRMLCLGVLAPHKGQDVLAAALSRLDPGLLWECVVAGSDRVAPEFAAALTRSLTPAGTPEGETSGSPGRTRFPGVLSGPALEQAWQDSDLLVAPSRVESYGMAVSEALARGIPVVASDVGGLPEAVAGNDAAVLIPPDDPAALHAVLNRWLVDVGFRSQLKSAALAGRSGGRTWPETAAVISSALHEARAVHQAQGSRLTSPTGVTR